MRMSAAEDVVEIIFYQQQSSGTVKIILKCIPHVSQTSLGMAQKKAISMFGQNSLEIHLRCVEHLNTILYLR